MAQKIDMLNGGLFKKIIIFTIPIMLQGLLQSVYNAADLAIVGQFTLDPTPLDGINEAGTSAVAAVGSTTSIFNVLVGLFMGLSVGVDVVSSYQYGRGEHKNLKKLIDTAVIIAPLLGILVGVVGFFVSGPVLEAMETTEKNGVLENATIYLQILMLGIPFSMMFNFISAVLRTAGETNKPFIFLAISGALNVILNMVFCKGFNLSVVGVAIATVISQVLSAALIFIYLVRRKDIFTFSFKNISFSFEMLWKIIKIGLPAGLQSAAFSLSNTFLQTGVNSFDNPDVNAGSTAVGTVEGLMWVTLTSFQNATTTFMSQNLSVGNLARARKVLRYTLLMTASLGIVIGMGAFLLKEPIMSIFIKDNPSALQYSFERLMFTFPPYFLAGVMGVMPGAIRAFGYSLPPSLITIIGTCGIRILWVYTVFQAYHQLNVLYLVHPITWVLTNIALFTTYFIVLHKYKKKQKVEKQEPVVA